MGKMKLTSKDYTLNLRRFKKRNKTLNLERSKKKNMTFNLKQIEYNLKGGLLI